ncbi:hypothetical protein [Brevundimonas faecalis]|uniref:Uncharacterized protein n=1 Tax=Brevundimonas faecalis TaxID=947378 RepID=A0ABV2RBQ1_9CAUL
MMKPDIWAIAPNQPSMAMCAAGERAIQSRPVQQAEACWREMWKVMLAETVTPLSWPAIQDFGWALAQMRAGQKVRLPHWDPSEWIAMNGDGQIVDEDDAATRFTSQAPILATDWRLADV